VWCDVGPETQGGLFALHRHHQASCHLCILGMVAWLSDSQCQQKVKQHPKTCLFRDNMVYAHCPECYGSTHLPSPTSWWLKARQGGLWGCSPYLNSNQEHTVVWLQLQRVDPTSSVQDHTTVLLKVTMLYFINNFYLRYRN